VADRTTAERLAGELAELARQANLIVHRLEPQLCHGGYDCFRVDLAMPDGSTWMEASHESETSIRQAIMLWARGDVGHGLDWTRENGRDGTWSAGCLCGQVFRAQDPATALRGVQEHWAEEAEWAEATAREAEDRA
jgi:hypothetical protein